MVIETPSQPLTYEEERGKPMPSLNHAGTQVNLIIELAKHREFRVYSELTLEFEGRPYTPDLSIYPKEKLDFRHDVVRRTDPPLLAVEILSPRQGYQDVMEKLDVYFRNGVKNCWVVSPPIRTITIYCPDGQPESFHTGVVKDPVTGVTADLAAVFS
jgi:Uma2 family endonuclease